MKLVRLLTLSGFIIIFSSFQSIKDHHVHLANQTISFDWQFYAEMLFLEKVKNEL